MQNMRDIWLLCQRDRDNVCLDAGRGRGQFDRRIVDRVITLSMMCHRLIRHKRKGDISTTFWHSQHHILPGKRVIEHAIKGDFVVIRSCGQLATELIEIGIDHLHLRRGITRVPCTLRP
jgi:hypothetical protein